MATVPRISAEEARRKVESGQARLICAYDDEARCRSIAIDGSIPLTQFEAQAASLPRNQELIFYCA